MIAASVGALRVDGASTAQRIKIETIVIGHAAQGKHFIFEIEMFDDPFFFKLLGQFLWLFLTVKITENAHADEIVDLHFDWHGTAGCPTGVTQA